MMMTEEQIRLNEVILAVKKAVDFLCFIAEQHEEHSPFPELESHVARYRSLIAELEKEEQQVGGLPRDPDPEHELMEQMFTRFKPLLTGDRESVLLEEFNKYRNQILTQTRHALEWDWPANIRATLEEIEAFTHSL